jgi:hypothetical protein
MIGYEDLYAQNIQETKVILAFAGIKDIDTVLDKLIATYGYDGLTFNRTAIYCIKSLSDRINLLEKSVAPDYET